MMQLTAICHYALHQASSNTKFRLTQEEIEDLSDERNLNWMDSRNFKNWDTRMHRFKLLN